VRIILYVCSLILLIGISFFSSSLAFATHIEITATDAETDGVNGFTELEGAANVATFTVNDIPYAIVASYTDDGVQVINLSDPANITVSDAETDGANGFTALNGANDVAVFTVSNVPYAIVTGYDDNGVQIINLSDPTNITAEDAEIDEANGFTELGSANDVATFTVSGVPYAIVVSEVDDGVQIINLSDPTNITAEDAETDEANGFTELNGAAGVATFTISNVVYAIVTSIDDNGVQIINVNDPTNIVALDAETDNANGFTELDNVSGVDIFTSNNITYAIVGSAQEDGIQIINLSDPTDIVAGDTAKDGVDGFTHLDVYNIETFTSNNIPYAIVTSRADDGVQIINLSDPTNITASGAATEGGEFTELDGPYGVATFTVGGSLYAIISSELDSGVQIISLPIHTTSQTVNDRIEIDNDNIDSDLDAGDLFGYHIENIGDLDSDGIVDLAAVLFADDVPLQEADIGSILILFMNSDGSVKSTNKINMDDTADGLGGSSPGSQNCIVGDGTNTDTFGMEQIEFVGDLDDDGKPTLAIGVAEATHGDVPPVNSGAIYMVELFPTGKVDTCLRIVSTGDGTGDNGFNPAASVYNVGDSGNDAELGRILIATDVNGDGRNELIAGAVTLGASTNDMWTLFLTTTGAVDSFVQITATDIGVDTGDVLNDGSVFGGGTKILLGDKNGGNGGGSIHIVTLTSGGAFSSVTEIAGYQIPGIANDENFGRGVAFLGDMDADGIDDILVGNYAGDDTNSLSGEAHILFLNSDDTLKESQKISNESENTRNGSTPFAASDLFGHGMELWVDSGGNAVIAISAHQDDTGSEANSGAIHLFYITRATIEIISSKSSGGCGDCIPPTFGKNKSGKLLVSEGFIFNGNAIDVTGYHTEFPLITVITNQTNTVTVKMYENNGVNNIRLAQFGMGMPEVGSPLNDAQTLLEIWIIGAEIEGIKKIEKYNLVDILNATAKIVDCGYVGSDNCLQITFEYVYRDQPKYNIMAINAMDNSRNGQTNYINDGILVIGKTLNEPLEQNVSVSNAGAHYPQNRGTTLLSLVDYKTDMWQDGYGYMWSANNYGPYLVDKVPIPKKVQDKFSKWSGYNDRYHSEFKNYVEFQSKKAEKLSSEIYPAYEQYNDDFFNQKVIESDFRYGCYSGMKSVRESCVFDETMTYEIQRAELITLDYSNWKN